MPNPRSVLVLSVVSLVAGAALTSAPFWVPLVLIEARDAGLPDPPIWIAALLSVLLDALVYGGMYCAPLLLLGAAGISYSLLRAGRAPRALLQRPYFIVSLVVIASAHAIVLFSSSPLFEVPPGAGVRPVKFLYDLIFLALCAPVAGIPLSLLVIVKEKPRLLGVIPLLLSFTPFPFGIGILFLAKYLIGFHFSH